ncbi:hypothetical protein NL676_017668 [Syzygium grande]|nr:hypothetical protein NL676_017668 [Syzygium grande]
MGQPPGDNQRHAAQPEECAATGDQLELKFSWPMTKKSRGQHERRMEGFTRKRRGATHGSGAVEAISHDGSDREVRESSRTACQN